MDTYEIIEYIEQMQEGKSGIYPYRVAQDVAIEFTLTVSQALDFVLWHIRNILAA